LHAIVWKIQMLNNFVFFSLLFSALTPQIIQSNSIAISMIITTKDDHIGLPCASLLYYLENSNEILILQITSNNNCWKVVLELFHSVGLKIPIQLKPFLKARFPSIFLWNLLNEVTLVRSDPIMRWLSVWQQWIYSMADFQKKNTQKGCYNFKKNSWITPCIFQSFLSSPPTFLSLSLRG